MATLRVYDYWEVTDAQGIKFQGGSRSAPIEIEVTPVVDDRTKSLATATTWDAWITGAEEALTEFDFFWMIADQDVRVELTVDKGNEVGDEVIALLVEANTPFRLIYDDALAAYTADFVAGTADVVDRVRIRNVSGKTAIVRRVLVT